MQEESVRVAQAFIRAFNDHDLGKVAALQSESFFALAPDSPEPRIGRKGGRKWIEAIYQAFPDAKLLLERVFSHDRTFVVQALFQGTHRGLLEGPVVVPPTGRRVRVPVVFIGLVQDGAILDFRGYWDQFAMLSQLGVGTGKA